MTIAIPPSRSIYAPGVSRTFHRFAVSYWPTPGHRERVEVEVPAHRWRREEALRIGARRLGRPDDECCIGYISTVTRRID
jgi:hypothetical protein